MSSLTYPSRVATPPLAERTVSEQCAPSPAASSDSLDGEAAADPTILAPFSARSLSTSSGKWAYTTEIVKALFGGSPVGDVVRDFSCSFQRQSGRLYVSTQGLFFYSNLFGFEKRMRINYDQASDIVKLRTTSLSVKTVQGEEYIFRSFEDRERVLDVILILSYHSNGGGTTNDDSIPPSLGEASPVSCDKSPEKTLKCDSAVCDGSPVSGRSTTLRIGHSQSNDQKEKMVSLENACGKNWTDETRGGDTIVSNSLGDAQNDAMQLKKIMQHTREWEPAVENLKLSCKSVEDFFYSFLGDDAPNSLKLFQSESIGDKNVAIEPWTSDSDATEEATDANKSLLRTIQFEHKSGVAKVTRQQTCHIHGCHAYLKNVTTIKGKGLPDAFFVEDAWFIEDDENGGVVLNVKFRINFTKSTMLRSVIERRAKAETKEWYRMYSSFVRRKPQRKAPILEQNIAPAVVAAAATTDEGGYALFWDWFNAFASSAREYAAGLSTSEPPLFLRRGTGRKASMRGDLALTAANWFEFLTAISTILAISAITIYRLRLRVAALEGLVGELEHRLIELENLHFNAHH